MDFCSLQHLRNPRSTSSRALPARYVPPSGFGYPLDGLLPAIPCRFCFTPAALLGFALRSFRLSKGIRRITARMHPPTVSLAVLLVAVATGRPGKPRFLGFDPSENPWRSTVGLARRPLVAPVGLTLPGSARKSLDRDFARSPLTRFSDQAPKGPIPGAPESRSALAWLPSGLRGEPRRLDEATLIGFSHQRVPDHSDRFPSGLWVHLALRRTSLSTCQHS
jgi:hypothetical protein